MHDGTQQLEKLNVDIILRIVQYLSFQDVYALSVTSRMLHELCNACEIWMLSARGLLQRGIALPTNGFQKPDDLSSEELRASIVKAHKLDRRWNSSHAGYAAFTSFDTMAPPPENASGNAFQAGAKASTLVPITSNALLVVNDNDSHYAAWDISNFASPEMIGDTRVPPFQRLLAHGVDVGNSCAYLLIGPYQSRGKAHAASLMRANFASQDTATFETIANYPSFSEDGFFRLSVTVLDAEAKSLCIVYAQNSRIYLYVVLNWNLSIVALVDTRIDVPSPENAYTYDCVLLHHSEFITMRWEKRQCSLYGHEFHFKLSNIYPRASHTGELIGERLNNLPVVEPESTSAFPPPLGLPSNEEYVIQVVPSTPWHAYRDFRPPKVASVFHSLKYPTVGFTFHYADFESTGIFEHKHDFRSVARLSVQFGSAVWAERAEADNYYELRVARFVPCDLSSWLELASDEALEGEELKEEDEETSDDDDSEQEGLPLSRPCLLALPPALCGAEVLTFANIALDNVHGKLYFALPGGKVYVVAYV